MMGADSAEDPKENEEQQRDGDSYEPAFFNHLPVTLYSDALAAYEITGVLDCTPGAGDLAKAEDSLHGPDHDRDSRFASPE